MPGKILVIDDEEDIQLLVKMSLEFTSGHEVIQANNGLKGIEMAEREHPDAILLDVMMPKLDGIETYRRLQSNTETKDIPVIFLTAKTQSKEVKLGLQLGAKAYLTKPFDGGELNEELAKVLPD